MKKMLNASNEFEAFPLIEIEGAAFDRGVSYGEQAAERIALAASLYQGALSDIGTSIREIASLADAFLGQIGRFDSQLADEIRGISHGSGVSLAEVVLINARRELVSMAGQSTKQLPNDDECTAAAVLPESTTSGLLYHGQNWDTSPDHARHSLVLRVRRADGPDVLTFTEAGAVGRSGLNSAGVSITGNHLASDRDYLSSGVPLPLIRRQALEQPVFAQALGSVYSPRKSGSNNMMVSSAGGEIVNIECAPDEAFLLHPDEEGVVAHANHWESIGALAKLKDRGATDDPALAATPCTMFRSARIRRHLRKLVQTDQLTYGSFRDTFLDTFDAPFSICRPPRSAAVGGGVSATAATVVMSPSEGFMDVSPMPALGAVWTRYRVGGGAAETREQ